MHKREITDILKRNGVYVCVRACMYVYVCVCVCERERGGKRALSINVQMLSAPDTYSSRWFMQFAHRNNIR